MRLLACLVAVLALAGCTLAPAAGAPCAATAAYAASPCAPAPAAAPCAPAAVQTYAVAPAPAYGVAYGPPGAREYFLTGATVPLNWTACLATGAYKGVQVILDTANCIVQQTWPVPPPSTTYVPMAGQYQLVQPRAAASPCAPPQYVAPAAGPCGR